jgi:hypothetical protein
MIIVSSKFHRSFYLIRTIINHIQTFEENHERMLENHNKILNNFSTLNKKIDSLGILIIKS